MLPTRAHGRQSELERCSRSRKAQNLAQQLVRDRLTANHVVRQLPDRVQPVSLSLSLSNLSLSLSNLSLSLSPPTYGAAATPTPPAHHSLCCIHPFRIPRDFPVFCGAPGFHSRSNSLDLLPVGVATQVAAVRDASRRPSRAELRARPRRSQSTLDIDDARQQDQHSPHLVCVVAFSGSETCNYEISEPHYCTLLKNCEAQ